jgi:hypothetical protein
MFPIEAVLWVAGLSFILGALVGDAVAWYYYCGIRKIMEDHIQFQKDRAEWWKQQVKGQL